MCRCSDDSPSLKGRGFYGFAPRLCRPTASRWASFNTREVACVAPASRTSTTSKTRSCLYPRERLTVERPNTMQLARCYQAVSHISSDARLRARRQSSPALKRRGLLALKGKAGGERCRSLILGNLLQIVLLGHRALALQRSWVAARPRRLRSVRRQSTPAAQRTRS